ncbi:MAG: hypothetical protein A2073_08630 [Deltaproteobacteria bacterium GWC2_42_11]|nr:MAG: hypothetical protein A2073_08630 [Deltaproteobacteria bacterium GWC2_42_11]
MIEINITLLMQVIGFFVLLLILNGLLYKPVLNILEKREKNIEGAKKEAESLLKKLHEKTDAYEKRLHEARVKGHEERLKIRQAGLENERLILDNAKKEAMGFIADTKSKINEDVRSVMAGLKTDSEKIAREIAEKVLGRRVA